MAREERRARRVRRSLDRAHGHHVRAMVRKLDARADTLRDMGAEVVVADMLDIIAVRAAMQGCSVLYFTMSISPTYLEAAANVAVTAKSLGVNAFVNLSQMTLSQMSETETTSSPPLGANDRHLSPVSRPCADFRRRIRTPPRGRVDAWLILPFLTGGPADRDRLSRRTEPRDVIVVPQSVPRCGKTKSSSTSESA